jgi:hypothetical protein
VRPIAGGDSCPRVSGLAARTTCRSNLPVTDARRGPSLTAELGSAHLLEFRPRRDRRSRLLRALLRGAHDAYRVHQQLQIPNQRDRLMGFGSPCAAKPAKSSPRKGGARHRATTARSGGRAARGRRVHSRGLIVCYGCDLRRCVAVGPVSRTKRLFCGPGCNRATCNAKEPVTVTT